MWFDIFEFIAIILLCGLLGLTFVLIILAMCMVASNADDMTDELLEDGKEKEDGKVCDDTK